MITNKQLIGKHEKKLFEKRGTIKGIEEYKHF